MKILVQILCAAALFGTLLVQTAGAGVRPDDRSGVRLPGGVSQAEVSLDPAIAAAIQTEGEAPLRTSFVPDALDRYRANSLSAPDALGRYLRNSPDGRQPQLGPGSVAVAGGFDWVDAGIGAGLAFGLVLLVAAASVGGLRRRRTAALS